MSRLVSVVIPTYNHAHFLGRALQSVLNQTYQHWEALVVDNHSQDNTDSVVSKFCDPRIRLLKIDNHGVIAASRNLAIREANGEWLAFLDSDDCWYPKKLEVLMAAVEADDSHDVLSNDELMVNLNNGVRRILRYGPYQQDFYKVLLIRGNLLSPSATVIRRRFLQSHGLAFGERQDYVTVEDYSLWLDLARTGARFKFIHDVLGEYMIHENNNSTRMARHRKNGETLVREHVFNVQQFHPSPQQLWRQVSCRFRVGQVQELIQSRQFGLALKEAVGMMINSPVGTVTYLLSKLKKRRRM